ncbi:MAG: FkbM family methyltransferase [Firmicutes bacterium]|nr:FkbM family methyltransferase [Bacillota bacterium]
MAVSGFKAKLGMAWQSRTWCKNWLAVTAAIALRGALRGSVVHFHLRNGVKLSVPNEAMATDPIFELFSANIYRLPWQMSPITVMDVGAHVGAFTLSLLSYYPRCVVWAFEPAADSFTWLTRNVQQNDLDDRVKMVNAAVNGRGGRGILYPAGSASCINSMVASPGDEGTGYEVECIAWDSILRQFDHIDVVKMDVEGAEYDIVLNTPHEAWRCVDSLVMEYHPVAGFRWNDLTETLMNAGLLLVGEMPLGPNLGLAWFSRHPGSWVSIAK